MKKLKEALVTFAIPPILGFFTIVVCFISEANPATAIFAVAFVIKAYLVSKFSLTIYRNFTLAIHRKFTN